MIYVTAGDLYTDIDVFACAIAYSNLLKRKGLDSVAYLPGPLNASVTKLVKGLNPVYEISVEIKEEDRFVIVDLSNPAHIVKDVDVSKVIELYDHHIHGFQDFWEKAIGDKAKIERVGSCATLIWEEYKKFNIKIDSLNANLLIIAIVSNTLDFKSSVTNERDIVAFEELKEFIDLPENWKEEYFNEQSKFVLENPTKAIKEDTKVILDNITFGQIEIWNGSDFIKNNKGIAKEVLESFGHIDWMLSVPSISEGINYIYTESEKIKVLLNQTISVEFKDNIGITNKLWLRKEIREKLLKLNNL